MIIRSLLAASLILLAGCSVGSPPSPTPEERTVIHERTVIKTVQAPSPTPEVRTVTLTVAEETSTQTPSPTQTASPTPTPSPTPSPTPTPVQDLESQIEEDGDVAWDGGPNGSYVATVEVTNTANQNLTVTFDVSVTYEDDDGVVYSGKDGLIIDRLTATIEPGETLTITRDLPENMEDEVGDPRDAGAIILEVEA